MKTLLRWLSLSFALCPLAFLAGCGGTVTTEPATRRGQGGARGESQLEAVRQLLNSSPDRAACSAAVQQLNSYLAGHPDRRVPKLTAEERDLLQKRFALDEGELAEAENTTYTLLDASHLESCALLRDAARALEVDKAPQAEQAAAAFAWVMRQVLPQDAPGDPLPPAAVLRRGWGSDDERGYVFLALLHQMGIPGGFVMTPGASSKPWACAALVDVGGARGKEAQVILFDHRLGLPLPGAKGKAGGELARAFRLALPVPGPDDGREVATLAALRKQPELLRPLTTDEKQPYPVGAEDVQNAAVRLALPVSALAPRMRLLQDDLLGPGADLRPAAGAAALVRRFGAAPGVEGGADSVRGRDGAPGLLRRFLPATEGGTDTTGKKLQVARALVPRRVLPRDVQALEEQSDLKNRILYHFAQPFMDFQMTARQPRDLVLRGQYKAASEATTEQLKQLDTQKDKLGNDPDVSAKFSQWREQIYEAYGKRGEAQARLRKGGSPEAVEQANAQVEQLWRMGADVLTTMVDGSAAGPRSAQATYLQALCMEEQAERLQERADRLAHAEPPADKAEVAAARDAARAAWGDAASWWNTYLQNYPLSPLGIRAEGQARLLHARTCDESGRRDQARALLEDLSGDLTPHEKIARRYLARRLLAAAP